MQTILQEGTNHDGHENAKDENMEQMVRHQMSIITITSTSRQKYFVPFDQICCERCSLTTGKLVMFLL